MTRITKCYLKISSFIVLIICLTGCFIGAGTHGSIKGYRYSTTKDKLETAVMAVIKNNPNICRDSINKNYIIDVSDGKNDTIFDHYCNDGVNYLTIRIKDKGIEYEYIFRYYGSEEGWKVSSSSEIFICYIYDDKGNGGSEGNGGFKKSSRDIRKTMITLFETQFVSRLDKELNLTHIETE